MNTPEQQLSESLLAACKAVGIEKPKYIAQDKSGKIFHYTAKPNMLKREWLCGDFEDDLDYLNHPPYADHWKDSLLEWVEHIADTSKKVDDAIRMGYHKHVVNGDGLCWSRANDYRQGWQDALAWKGGVNEQ
jgi:hypothetical protein